MISSSISIMFMMKMLLSRCALSVLSVNINTSKAGFTGFIKIIIFSFGYFTKTTNS